MNITLRLCCGEKMVLNRRGRAIASFSYIGMLFLGQSSMQYQLSKTPPHSELCLVILPYRIKAEQGLVKR